ncbi:MAG: YggS family pyridoxal phosphate-dependent enzyme [Myxococcota bacterium]
MSVATRLAAIRNEIEDACAEAGRSPESVTLVAVSKRHSVDAIREAYAAGQRVFGENYAQELGAKAEALSDLDIEWRMIGHLQRNKVKVALGAGAAVDAVDSVRLVRAIERQATASVEVFLQVNVAQEPQKSGVSPDELGALVEAARACEHVSLKGLMTIPPAGVDPRGIFRALREHAATYELTGLSMGMSADLRVAIAEGATMVRIGTAIFGPRPSF